MTRSGATDRNVTYTSLTFVHDLLKCKMKAFWKKATEQQWLTWVHYFWLLPWTEHLNCARPWCKCPHAISGNPHWVLKRWYLYFTEGKQGWRSWVTWPTHDHIANPAGGRIGSCLHCPCSSSLHQWCSKCGLWPICIRTPRSVCARNCYVHKSKTIGKFPWSMLVRITWNKLALIWQKESKWLFYFCWIYEITQKAWARGTVAEAIEGRGNQHSSSVIGFGDPAGSRFKRKKFARHMLY